MINLQELKNSLDLALSQETEESLNSWLTSIRGLHNHKYNVKACSWAGLISENLLDASPVTSLIDIDLIKGFTKINLSELGDSALCGNDLPPPLDIRNKKQIFENNMTPNFSESFFLINIGV